MSDPKPNYGPSTHDWINYIDVYEKDILYMTDRSTAGIQLCAQQGANQIILISNDCESLSFADRSENIKEATSPDENLDIISKNNVDVVVIDDEWPIRSWYRRIDEVIEEKNDKITIGIATNNPLFTRRFYIHLITGRLSTIKHLNTYFQLGEKGGETYYGVPSYNRPSIITTSNNKHGISNSISRMDLGNVGKVLTAAVSFLERSGLIKYMIPFKMSVVNRET